MLAEPPRYRQIADELRGQAANSAPGDRLPSEAQLCSRFGVSRMTVRHALDQLVVEGVVDRRRGLGTFVVTRPVPRLLGSALSFTESMRRRGMVASSTVLRAQLAPAAPQDLVSLELSAPAQVVVVERLRLADGDPMALERAVLVSEFAPVLAMDLVTGSLHRAMESMGSTPVRAHAQVGARRADPREAGLLATGKAGVLLSENRVIWDQHGRAVEHTETLYAASRYVFEAMEHRDGTERA